MYGHAYGHGAHAEMLAGVVSAPTLLFCSHLASMTFDGTELVEI